MTAAPSTLSSRVRQLVAQTFGVPLAQVTEATGSTTLEAWDSMHQLHLIVALEAEFGVSFEPERAIELTSVGAIEDELRTMGAA